MTGRTRFPTAPLALALALPPVGTPMASGQGTPEAGAVAAGACIPEGSIEQKDSDLVGESQAIKGEPWRQVKNDQIAHAENFL